MTETQLQPSETAAPPAMGRGASFLPAIWDRATGLAGRRGFIIAFLVIGAVLPLLDHNEGDIDAGANALSYAILALGLNIVVGFAGLLDLGYAAFFAIGAYAYGIFSSYQVQPEWWGFLGAVPMARPRPAHRRARGARHRAFHGLLLAHAADLGHHHRLFRRDVRRADLALEG